MVIKKQLRKKKERGSKPPKLRLGEALHLSPLKTNFLCNVRWGVHPIQKPNVGLRNIQLKYFDTDQPPLGIKTLLK
jgi:hypothetical protein